MTKGLYVTTSVFKHASLLSRRTGEEPIFMGPLCLHGSLSTETYGTFMDHLARVLHRGGTDQLVIGSDNDADQTTMRHCEMQYVRPFQIHHLSCAQDMCKTMLNAIYARRYLMRPTSRDVTSCTNFLVQLAYRACLTQAALTTRYVVLINTNYL